MKQVCVVALGQARAGLVGREAVVVPLGNRQVEQRLEQPVHVAGMEQVLAARHLGVALELTEMTGEKSGCHPRNMGRQ